MLQEAQQKLAADDSVLRERISRAEAAAKEADSKLRRCVDEVTFTRAKFRTARCSQHSQHWLQQLFLLHFFANASIMSGAWIHSLLSDYNDLRVDYSYGYR